MVEEPVTSMRSAVHQGPQPRKLSALILASDRSLACSQQPHIKVALHDMISVMIFDT
jgi:hypothetical protein